MNKNILHYSIISILVLALILSIFKDRVWPNKPIIERVDTVSVITKTDSIKIATMALINARAKIAYYDIREDGSWVYRKPAVKNVLAKDTVWLLDTSDAQKVSMLDTSYTSKKDSFLVNSHLKVLFADSINAMRVEYNTKVIDQKDASSYSLLLQASLYKNKWVGNVKEDFNLKKKETTITVERKIPMYSSDMRNFWQRFGFGPVMAAGFDLNGKFNSFVGFGVFYDLR